MGVKMTSIIFSFILAFAKVLVKKGIITKKDLAEEFVKLRSVVKPHESMTTGDKEILGFLGVKEK
jgi:hypothetical protein